jgi:3',5'-cyclic AMP phosphodiesterase CpdA
VSDTEDPFVPAEHPGAVVATLDAPTSQTGVSVAVVADPHVATRASGTSKLFEQTRVHFENAVADISAREVDAVFSVGDLTKDGEDWNYAAVDETLADLEVPFYAVPGNHDVPKSRDEHDTMSVGSFADRYAPDGTFPFSTTVGDVEFVGINSAGSADYLYDSSEGGIAPDDREEVRESLAAADDPVALTHYNLPAMFEQLRTHRDAVEPEMFIPPEVRDGDAYVETLAAGDPSLVLTGHLHMPATVSQAGLRELMVPTTCSFPQGYYTLRVDADGTEVRFHPVAGRDGLRHGFAVRSADSTTSRGLTAIAADRLARFPLVTE